MVKQCVYLVCLLLILSQNADGSLQIKADPNTFSPGVSRDLTVTCSFSYDGASNISSIISLILSKAAGSESSLHEPPPQSQHPETNFNFIELESINVFTPDRVTNLSSVDGIVDGRIDANGESFLGIKWPYPSANHSGLYKCVAHGMDSTGHPVEMSQTAQVSSQLPELEHLIAEISSIQNELGNKERIINDLQMSMTDLEHTTQEQADTIDDMEQKQSFQEHVLEILGNTIFHRSADYKGHHFLLSKFSWENSTDAETVCEAYSGYLAEINDGSEHQFAKDFLDVYVDVRYVLVSGTDDDHDGQWVYTHSQMKMSYTDWYSGEPNDPRNQCMQIYKGNQWQMLDYPCTSSDENDYFMCEV